MRMRMPKSIDDLNTMISNKVMESIHLDYKAGNALNNGKPGEISKDVSAFANSDGGCIIYGVAEKEHFPTIIDEGVDHKQMSSERLEQIIQDNISPIIDNLEIAQIPLNESHSVYIVATPKSLRAPHQDRQSYRYYKRNNFRSVPMEDYEIQDVRNRQSKYPQLIHIDIEADQGVFLEFVVQNIGTFPAKDLRFEFSKDINWEATNYPQFKQGIGILPPGKKLMFLYGSTFDVFKENSKIEKSFSVAVSYFHPLADRRVTDSFDIDINSLNNTSIIYSEIYHHGKKLEDSIKKLIDKMHKIDQRLESIASISGPTGLNISMSTLKNIASLLNKEFNPAPLDPKICSYDVFMEVLGIDAKLALRLHDFFQFRDEKGNIEDIEGVNADLAKNIEKHFIF